MGISRLTILAFALLAIAAIAACGGGDEEPSPYPVQEFADQGRDHLPAGATFDNYNSNPPTSGPHAPRPAAWGVSDQPIAKETLVHNMEHGGVVVWYNCQGGPQPLDPPDCSQLRDQMGAIVREFVNQRKLVVMSPYSGMPERIALTAWRKLDKFSDFDEQRVRDFIRRYERAFNPEGF
ncbi:MAG TPA: DUF3105 domain-containing protein [Dehalococcoidia bacterium]|nr:DUF3105 domain-containing protein [Dehalococcoidia bacterium]